VDLYSSDFKTPVISIAQSCCLDICRGIVAFLPGLVGLSAIDLFWPPLFGNLLNLGDTSIWA
jgi:hypothetical protein